jgi:inhibitor of cysteine peptidase
MKSAIWAGLCLALALSVRAAESPAAATADDAKATQTEQGVSKVDAAPAPNKAEIAVGEVFQIKLKCNPTTGYNWELKSINRKIAVPTGPVEFQQNEATPGMVGVGGGCVLGVKGVKPGKTKAVLVYRRSWEKGEPAETFKTVITVLPKK